MLIFPSRGPESLSRVLIEASALGVPIAAMNTGGTADIVIDDETGLLSETPEELADDVRRLRGDAELRARLGAAARLHAALTFRCRRRRRAGRAALRRIFSKALDEPSASRRGRRALGVPAPRSGRPRAQRLRSRAPPLAGGRRGHAHHAHAGRAGRSRGDRPAPDDAVSCRIARSRSPAAAGRPFSIAARRIRSSASVPGRAAWELVEQGTHRYRPRLRRERARLRAPAAHGRRRRSSSTRRGSRNSARPIRRGRG